VVIGVHTPETAGERQVERVREKVEEYKLDFPVVVDNDNAIWNAWGNSIWPSVYLIDKQGRLRYWWYGELNWQEAGGQKIMAQHIEELLAESES
jgi:peroxiredoxin